MNPPRENRDLASGESAATDPSSSAAHPADPSDSFLERKARRRAAASAQPQAAQRIDHPRFYRADTSSGAHRPWNSKAAK